MTPGFAELFGRPPEVSASAPGRVNLIGEHTDYSGGFVLPAAIPQRTTVELARRKDATVRVFSTVYPQETIACYQLGSEARENTWADYVKGMTWVLAPTGLSHGFEARIHSDVPVGSGLSSSAALEIALGRALREAFSLDFDDMALALAARRAENEFVGAPVGIMDQMACTFATEAAPIFLDTRSLEFVPVPLPATVALVVIDSGVAHRHAGGAYAERRRECVEAAVRLGVPDLRDATIEMLQRASLPDTLRRRARHVITENARVLITVEALRAGELERVGSVLAESHASLRDDFEVSVPAVDALVEEATRAPGVYGARLTGGGFGGAIVALAVRDRARTAAAEILDGYAGRTGMAGRIMMPAR